MTWEAWAAIGTVFLIVFAMARGLGGPDTVLVAGLFVLMTLGLFAGNGMFPTPAEAVAGFGNEGVITIAVLFVVAEGMRQTGAMNILTKSLLGRPKTVMGAQTRLLVPVATLSAFLNNTPIVAMFIPVVRDWC
ncbi:MAG: SLC13 family permease, partial [Pirellulaceae bacterium]|nr:SLC13 family permease [Pirellulaceae bacterium]